MCIADLKNKGTFGIAFVTVFCSNLNFFFG
jgi:hypothetical protein